MTEADKLAEALEYIDHAAKKHAEGQLPGTWLDGLKLVERRAQSALTAYRASSGPAEPNACEAATPASPRSGTDHNLLVGEPAGEWVTGLDERLDRTLAPMKDRLRAMIGWLAECGGNEALHAVYADREDPEADLATDIAFVLAALEQRPSPVPPIQGWRPDREAVARKLAELKGHRDLEAPIWINDDWRSVPVWQCYLSDADQIIALGRRG